MLLTDHGHDIAEELVELYKTGRSLLAHAQSTGLAATCGTS
jgi:hypothetical protein